MIPRILLFALFFATTFVIPVVSKANFPKDTVRFDVLESDNKVIWGLETDFLNKYIFRGFTINDGFVIQPAVWAEWKNFSLTGFGNITMFDRFSEPKEREFDLILAHSFSLGNLEITNSLNLFTFYGPVAYPNTCEYMLSGVYPFGDLAAYTSVAADFVAYPGALYFEHGLLFEKTISDRVTINSKGIFSWGNGRFNLANFETNGTSLCLATLDGGLTFMINDFLYTKPHFQYNLTLNKEISNSIGTHPWFVGIVFGVGM